MTKLRVNPKFDNMLMSVRTRNVLCNCGINSLDELTGWTAAELLREPNFGMKSLHEILDGLAIRSLSLKRGYLRAIETAEGEKLFRRFQIAKLKWEIYRDKYDLELRRIARAEELAGKAVK